MTIGVLVSSRVIDYWVKLKSATNQMTPEQRLPLMILGGMLLPAGLFIFGVRASPEKTFPSIQIQDLQQLFCPDNACSLLPVSATMLS